MEEKEKIGGRAYKNGVRLMNSQKSVKAFYNKNNKLEVEVCNVKKNKYIKYIKKIPVLRGIASLFFAILSFLKEVFKNPKKYWFIFLIIFLDLIYIFIPEFSADSANILESIYLILYFMVPVALIIFFKDGISEVLKFHGAEHKAVHYYENDYKGEIASYSRIHRRCGSNIVFYYLLITIIASFFNLNFNFLFQELLFLGLAYEAIKYTPENLLFFPSLFQKIVTREPEKRQIKAAKKALEVLTQNKN
ncbi:MAG: DUF1385 domain-containing protein [Bacillota bacterium]